MRLAAGLFATLLFAAPAFAAPAFAAPAFAPPAKSDTMTAADRSMMAQMARMNQAMQDTPMTGSADHDFVAMMIPHHQGAIDMANAELQFGHDPQLHRMAKDIIAAQTREIRQMNDWLAKHRK